MVLKILLVISVILQLVAAIISVRLMTRTKYNLSWILFTVALTAMVATRAAEFAEVVWDKVFNVPQYFFVWMGVLTSLCFAVGIFLVRKIFNWIDRINHQQRLTEKRILNTVLRTEEKERLRFSKELHDGLGPLLSSARMSLSALDKTAMGNANRELLDNTNYVIEEAIRSLREISNNLSPHILNDFGLGRGVGNFINKLPSKGSCSIDFETNLKNERFDTDVEVILYRVICELLNNSVKHSGGSRIKLSLWQKEGILGVDYSDNGRGFNPSAMMDVGMGLSNISSRISSIKGTCDITSEQGGGMKAQIRINLNEKDGRSEK
ncbi:MAG: histidine kinase [Rikenellaceae bacterium]|nr:histidine kinase [Rikenellaceae bacterium]